MENNISFTKQIKNEICNNFDFSNERKIAILSAFIKNNGIFRIADKKYTIVLKTDNAKTAKYIYKLINEQFNILVKFAYETNRRFKEKTYYVLIIEDNVDELLKKLKIDFFSNKIDNLFYSNDEYRYGYIIGLFLSSGSCNNPTSSNYHLEIAFDDPNLACDAQQLINSINSIDFNIRITKRRNRYVLYIKKSDVISSFLILIGAIDSCLAYENMRVERDFSNIDNRLLNLDGANVKKTIDASKKQIDSILILDKLIEIDNLENEKLKLLCRLRLENEEASLFDLAQMLSTRLNKNVSKSNVSHLFKKIDDIVAKYEGK